MTHLPSARSRRSATSPDLIIDGRLAFSEHGLMLSLALARVRRVWLVQGLWALLQRFEVIDYPEFADEGEATEAMLPSLRQWHAIWTGSTQLEQFCWVGDLLFESRLPPEFDQCAARRLQTFATLLEQFAASDGPISALTVCARDAAALAALNMVEAPVILTDIGADDTPRLVRFLDSASIDCRMVEGGSARRLSQAALGADPPPAVALALDCGVRVAALQVLAPRAVTAALEDDAEYEPDDAVYSDEHDPWSGASAIWCEVTP
ncbi:hypothetical protein [Maliponia aquimaris]|uniref:Uncharacterized protein n=1 Tax=Maliponia aquimaris TaxID=1673631 RepID=A0A238L669_9RHOB|nr:hypothetical protein [Maliponia aquimaris]SMX50311.1 hypothetical protein MAA8898_04715 [Maliponia aquimaris]